MYGINDDAYGPICPRRAATSRHTKHSVQWLETKSPVNQERHLNFLNEDYLVVYLMFPRLYTTGRWLYAIFP